MTIENKSLLIVLAFAMILVLMTCARLAWSHELDKAYEELQSITSGEVKVEIVPITYPTQEQINIMKKAREEMEAWESSTSGDHQ